MPGDSRISKFQSVLGDEIEDPDEETFTLFSQSIPSQNLGFIDPKASTLHLTVAGKDLEIQQSPSLLSSDRQGGTTGAVVWKVTPLFADWLARDQNWLFQMGILGSDSTVLELGCGVSGITAMVTAPRVQKYICTDQEYVFRLLRANLESNNMQGKSNSVSKVKKHHKSTLTRTPVLPAADSISVLALDWESDVASGVLDLMSNSSQTTQSSSIDVVVACDCIYNEALIGPFVQTCADVCAQGRDEPAVCIVAQQLRSDLVFDEWLRAFHRKFHVWRMPDHLLTDSLKGSCGYTIHAGLLRKS